MAGRGASRTVPEPSPASAAAARRNGPGRPRHPEVEEGVLKVTLDLLRRVSYADLSIEMIAKQAGVGKGTVYRRWASKLELVADAYGRASDFGTIPDVPASRLRAAIRAAFIEAHRQVARAGLGHVVLSLVGEIALHPESGQEFINTYVAPRRRMFISALSRAVEEGLLRPDTDVALMHDLLAGHGLFRSFQAQQQGVDVLTSDEVAETFDKVWGLFRAEPVARRRRATA